MKKIVSVLVAGIPINSSPVGFSGTGGKKATKYISNSKVLEEKYFRNGTDWIRKPLVKSIKTDLELIRRDIEVQITDFQECFVDNQDRVNSGFDEQSMLENAKEFEQESSKFDLVIVVGGDHTGGIYLYAFDGNVIRFDEHSDSCKNPKECERGFIQRNNYVCSVIRNKLKNENQITGIGIREGEFVYQKGIKNNSFEKVDEKTNYIFDLDIDVFAQKYNMKSDYSKGILAPSDFIGFIRKYGPNVMGFFEIKENDKNAYELIYQSSIEAVVQVAKKRKSIKTAKEE